MIACKSAYAHSMPRDSVQLGHQMACGCFLFLVLLQVLLMCGRDSTLPVLLCGVGGVLIVSQGRDLLASTTLLCELS